MLRVPPGVMSLGVSAVRTLRHVNTSKVTGPDTIAGRTLRDCANELTGGSDICNISRCQAAVLPVSRVDDSAVTPTCSRYEMVDLLMPWLGIKSFEPRKHQCRATSWRSILHQQHCCHLFTQLQPGWTVDSLTSGYFVWTSVAAHTAYKHAGRKHGSRGK